MNKHSTNEKFIRCSVCNMAYHWSCLYGKEHQEYDITVELTSEWKCPLCKSKKKNISSDNTPIKVRPGL